MPNPSALIIESDTAFAAQLSAALQQIGFSTETIEDGPQGLARAKESAPDLIALCVELPKMSGYAVCNKLKKNKKLRAIPLVIMSAEATPETFEQHRKLKTRADEYILKTPSFDVDEFLTKVREVMPEGWDEGGVEEVLAPEEVEEDGMDLSFGDDDATGVDPQLIEDANAALDALSGDQELEVSFGEDDVPVGEVLEEEVVEDLEEAEADQDGGLDLELDKIADIAAATAASPEAAATEALEQQLAELVVERDALAAEVESLKTSGGGGGLSRDREFLNLREVINKKEKEILDLKDGLTAKDRELLDSSDKIRALERASQDLDSKLLEMERERVEASEQVASLQAQVGSLEENLEGLRAEVSEKQASLEAHQGTIDSLVAEKQELEEAKAAELAAAAEELERALQAAAEEKAALQSEHKEELQRIEDQQAGEVLRLKEEHEAALAEAREQAEAALAEAKEQAEAALAEAREQHARDQEAALAEAREQAEAALAEAKEQHARDQEAALAEARERHAQEQEAALAEAREQHEAALSEAQQQQADALAGAGARHQAELEEAQRAHQEALTEVQGRVEELERSLAEAQERADGLKTQLGEARAGLEERDAAMAAKDVRIAELEQELDTHREHMAAAVDRMNADRMAVSNTKKALVVALTLLEEQFEEQPDEEPAQ